MTYLRMFLFAATLVFGLGALAPVSVHAGSNDPLFVNVTSDDLHRVRMAFTFSGHQLGRGHPLTVYLNDKAVAVASKSNTDKFAEQQKQLAELMGKGAKVLICPMCMKHYGVKESDLLPGIAVGNPELVGNALFQEGAQTLTW